MLNNYPARTQCAALADWEFNSHNSVSGEDLRPECPGEIRYDSSALREQVVRDPYDYARETEAVWRARGAVWEIADVFEILKGQFWRLHFVPTSEQLVTDVDTLYSPTNDEVVSMLQNIYHEHGWDDLQKYRTRECLEAVKKALEEHYP
ncbi:uncharacterized protein CIMG_09102 [Coccidioides immitis RS]|uniref:Uncharacterized protein n=1 Tax=Coccidioides immitis (strain RS) TaxID=246410 RepID=A0A0E1S087_COCIM|nr:uncharacterized protein CIMG_09102 [Coccidioides immitis RS]EAS27898.2 hypothetical protein CIMG_09102 [Coccidioides immitis RS]